MQLMNGKLPLFWDAELLRAGVRYPVVWDYEHFPHLLVVGSTGSGKTYAVKLIIGRISKFLPGASVTVADFKADDFTFLRGCSRYYEFTDCKQGLDDFYNSFLARQQGNNLDRSFSMLVFDEWASFLLNHLDKREAEEAKRKLSTLLMLGRSFNCHILVSQQRADAQYFSTARDNFNTIIALGNISKESAAMFGFNRDSMQPVRQLGGGYMLTNGTDLQEIQVPSIRDPAKLNRAIQTLVK
ncbi:type IV secretory system conjugative DNA transfer family protein [Faecalispora jeddahensis]|uniref:type IV secretory system conjugative DNA transfer family protein n=1 Tax=Faecalispora jeddahensis TaxID=1414721 RepID=UPI0027B8E572|nr:DUF87 domain-containing protein [Faecalispora jeddahensis]